MLLNFYVKCSIENRNSHAIYIHGLLISCVVTVHVFSLTNDHKCVCGLDIIKSKTNESFNIHIHIHILSQCEFIQIGLQPIEFQCQFNLIGNQIFIKSQLKSVNFPECKMVFNHICNMTMLIISTFVVLLVRSILWLFFVV